DRRDIAMDQRGVAHDRADFRADRRDMWRDGRDMRADRADLRHDYAAQRAGGNNQRDIARDQADIRSDRADIQRDRADIRSDQQDIRKARADLRADQRDLRNEHSASAARVARNGGPSLGTQRETAAMHSGSATTVSARAAVNGQGADSVQRAPGTQPNAKPQGLTPTVMANNAAAENKKPPSTRSVHQAWYHWVWW